MNKIKEVIKCIHWQLGICALFVTGILIVSPTPIGYFCSGWCIGITITDTMYTYYRHKKDNDK